ncbi:hypothetical protein RLDS_06240 [Sphingobium lactosutens DS20]|uniref:Uncharacterized protein n=1 Tax=Sphingobium lactosutens DS20 TaxID=1331060 RepID=T0J4Y6_9SPHN|nr:hypothetical protein RLDS_06240 [Sphingobium lactosutens DS20]
MFDGDVFDVALGLSQNQGDGLLSAIKVSIIFPTLDTSLMTEF